MRPIPVKVNRRRARTPGDGRAAPDASTRLIAARAGRMPGAMRSQRNAPGTTPSPHWQQGLQFLPEVRVQAGSSLPLLAEHDGSALRLRWPADAIAAEALSTLPRFDPRWLAANHELEQQMRGLMRHCAQHPDEYWQVARIAQHFAIDPGAHGLDPAIAQRFASMFFAA